MRTETVPGEVWYGVIKDLAVDADAAVIAAHVGSEILSRAPKFFNKDRLTRFLHAISRLEYVFPEINWNEVSVRELSDAAEQALQALPGEKKGKP